MTNTTMFLFVAHLPFCLDLGRKPIEHFLKAIDKVTLKDITTITEKIISSPLTMASWGDGMLKRSKWTLFLIVLPLHS